ncbi:MAG TPA: pitrilysin family protein [Bryobacteraceae bacterium]|jgi:zinc protease
MLAKLLLTLLALTFWVAIASAADSPPKVFPFAYTQEDLPNGLRLITIPTESKNLVSLFIVVQAGSRNEVEPGKTGFAHLFEHLMFRGTPNFPPAKRDELIKRAGAASNASTSDDRTTYYMTFSKEDLPALFAEEADRFLHLKYSVADFKTETGAVLGEYNKNSSNPSSKLSEALRDTAFDRHTYKHTAMGFLKDIQDMPNQYDYSLSFFDRYYRPEYTTIILAGDVNAKEARALVERNLGAWKRGTYHADIPIEPPQQGPREKHVDWPTATLPQIAIAYKAPAYMDDRKDTAALDVLAELAFSQTSDLYQKLVIEEQKVDALNASSPQSVDPDLFTIQARVKRVEDLPYVKDQILATVTRFQNELPSAAKLEALKKRERYGLALSLDNPESVARAVAEYVGLRRTPASIDAYFQMLSAVAPEDVRAMARKYLVENNRTIVTLTGPAAGGGK